MLGAKCTSDMTYLQHTRALQRNNKQDLPQAASDGKRYSTARQYIHDARAGHCTPDNGNRKAASAAHRLTGLVHDTRDKAGVNGCVMLQKVVKVRRRETPAEEEATPTLGAKQTCHHY